MNIFNYNKVLYKGNIDRDFYLFVLKKDIKLIKYLFINIFYYIVSILISSKRDIYEINKYRYMSKLKDVEELIKEFYSKSKKINNYINDSKDIIIDNVLEIFIDKEISKNIIGYTLDDKYRVKLDLYRKKVNEISNSDKLFIRNRYMLENIKSNNTYIVRNNIVHYIGKRKTRNILLRDIGIVFVLSILLTIISFCFTCANLDLVIYEGYFEPLLFILNFLPIFIVMIILMFLFKRVHISFLITSAFILALGIANQTKVLYRDDVVNFEDLTLLKEASIMSTRYDIVIKKYTVLAIILVIVIFLILRNLVKKINIKLRKQVIFVILSSALMILGYKLIYTNENVYNSVGNVSLINRWIGTRQSQFRGLIYPFVYSISEYRYEKPDNYNEVAVKKTLESYKYQDIDKDKKVNIIGIMLEAYNDFSKFDNISFNYDVYKNLHEIEENSLHGNLVTKIFGGGTVNTERNFLTGFYNLPSIRSKTNSYAWYFKEQGYNVNAYHPIYGSFYNRITAFNNLGFDNYYYYENTFSSVKTSFLEDNEFFDYIISGYEDNKSTNKPYFSFAVTYQNHGPYNSENYLDKVYYIDDLGYSEETYNTVSEYFYGIRKTDEAIKKLVDYFDNEEEAVIVILFGDHNPYLGENGYEELGINLDRSSVDGFLNYYETPYVIHANNSAKEMFNKSFVGKTSDISPIFLMNELFDYIDLKGNSYMQYMSELKNNVDVISNYFYKENGSYVLVSDSNYKNIVNTYYDMNYYYGNNYLERK